MGAGQWLSIFQNVTDSADTNCHFPPSSVQKMPRATLTYNLPDEQGDYDAARLGSEAMQVLWQIDQRCRSLLKYGEPSGETRQLAEEIRGLIPAELLDI